MKIFLAYYPTADNLKSISAFVAGLISTHGYSVDTHQLIGYPQELDPKNYDLGVIFWNDNGIAGHLVDAFMRAEVPFLVPIPFRGAEVPPRFLTGGRCADELIRYYRPSEEVLAAIQKALQVH